MGASLTNKLFLFIDSGAYTAWRAGTTVNLGEYADYLKSNAQYITMAAGLDVIPGQPGHVATHEEVEASAKASYDNHQKLKSLGVTTLPVFHRGESFEWLERYLKDGELYIGLSPIAATGIAVSQAWLDEVFTLLTDQDGRPLVKTHGFAITKMDLLGRYPFTTVDSARWSLAAVHAKIFIPARGADGQPDFTKNLHQFSVGDRSNYFDCRPPMVQQYVRDYLASLDLDMVQIRANQRARMRVNLHFLQQAEIAHKGVRFKHPIADNTFTSAGRRGLRGRKPIAQDLRIISACFPNSIHTNLLRDVGFSSILMSYATMKTERKLDTLPGLQSTGSFPSTTRPPRSLKLDRDSMRWRRDKDMVIHRRSMQDAE